MVKIILISLAVFFISILFLFIGNRSNWLKNQYIIYSLIIAIISLIVFIVTSAIMLNQIGN